MGSTNLRVSPAVLESDLRSTHSVNATDSSEKKSRDTFQIKREIEGATSAGSAVPSDIPDLTIEQLNIPPCPEQFKAFIEDTSLERLVYWKLQDFFDKIEGILPDNILEVVHAHIERPLFALVLQKTVGNQSKAAKVLGCNRNTLHRKLKALLIQPMELRRALKSRDRKNVADVVNERRILP